MNPVDYVFVPLEIPKFEFNPDLLFTFFERHKSIPQYDFLKEIDDPWFAYEARAKDHPARAAEIPGSGWDTEFREAFPQIVATVEKFPFQQIERVYFLQQRKEVRAHRDVSKEDNSLLGPSTFRCPIINDEPEKTFYLEPISQEKKCIFPKMPPDTQWFGMNNYSARHGSFMPSPTAKKLMFCVWGKLEHTSWFNLLERSIKRYPKYCISVADLSNAPRYLHNLI